MRTMSHSLIHLLVHVFIHSFNEHVLALTVCHALYQMLELCDNSRSGPSLLPHQVLTMRNEEIMLVHSLH